MCYFTDGFCKLLLLSNKAQTLICFKFSSSMAEEVYQFPMTLAFAFHTEVQVFLKKKNAGLEFFQRNLCQYHNSLEWLKQWHESKNNTF